MKTLGTRWLKKIVVFYIWKNKFTVPFLKIVYWGVVIDKRIRENDCTKTESFL